MQTLSFEAVRGPRPFFLFVFAILLAAASERARAQIGTMDNDPAQAIGTRLTARNTIQGNVALPSGHSLGKRVKVRITGQTGQTLFTLTDDQGNFAFRRLAGGTYFLTVEAGEEFQTANETVDIFTRSQTPVTQHVYIQLRYKKTTGEKPGTVDAALAEVPKPALKHYEQALKASRDGDGNKAIESLKKAVELHPGFVLAYNEMGLQYLALNKLDEAAEALLTAIRLAPDSFVPLLNHGIVLFYRKEYDKSAAQLRLALQKRDGSASARFLLGRALIKLNQYAEAEKELRQAVEIGGAEVNDAYRYLGGIYVEMGDAKSAIEALEKYLSLVPKAKDAEAVRQIIAQLRTHASTIKK